MIDWFGVFHNALWVMGLATILAALSYVDWWRTRQLPRLGFRQALGTPGFLLAFNIGAVLFCSGLALGSHAWWQIVAWSILALMFAWQALVAWRTI